MTDITMDFEFLDLGNTVHPISVGLASELGTYYAVNAQVPWKWVLEHDWLRSNVVPFLPTRGIPGAPAGIVRLDLDSELVKPQKQIADEIEHFVLSHLDPKIWCYYGAYDWVCLGSFYKRMIDMPKGFPMWFHELMQLWEDKGRNPELKPPHTEQEHHALADAKWNLEFLRNLQRA